jgi:quercetin dioxygenase-like cupin family protein
VPAHVTPNTAAPPPSLSDLTDRLERAGLRARRFSNAPGDRYGWHEHTQHKILFCAEGSITFHTRHADHLLRAGDRLDLPPRTSHAATVHDDGVVCIEAHASGPEALPPA